MNDEAPKRLSIAEKRALATPLQLSVEDRVEEMPVEAMTASDWTDAVLPDQAPKKLISLRVDPEVLEFFRSQGPGYQTRMHAVLQAYMQVKKELTQP
ncbi:BrnA antitoxin family protein [Tabrizicola sp.]|uniref:BrnA antitoxin family protein n=1 Tax=Tabrizicola sp. TaxID=2005166 RepID=UPI003F3CD0F7